MDALVSGDFGAPNALPPAFLRFARIFRAER
jgi:hypothetical protein